MLHQVFGGTGQGWSIFVKRHLMLSALASDAQMYQTRRCDIFWGYQLVKGPEMKTEYALSKHRFYELKHFCLQYQEWKKEYFSLVGYPETVYDPPSDTTSKEGMRRALLLWKMQIVEESCKEASPMYSTQLFRIVTKSPEAPRDPYMRKLYFLFFKLLDQKQ